jgi:NAD-dependent deacetylase
MKKIAVLTGAGISAESGLKTFRGADGLWEGHNVMEVASPEGFAKNPELVLRFYNERRKQAMEAVPNPGHRALVELEQAFDVDIITQNVDNLHEKAGSSRVLHLHGQLALARSVADEECLVPYEKDIALGDLAPDGAQLRPHIVWFGEGVPMIPHAARIVAMADILIIVGTSLLVYPANTLLDYASPNCPIYVVDPNKPEVFSSSKLHFLVENGSTGVPKLVEQLLAEQEVEP